jgi:hypothetical protein
VKRFNPVLRGSRVFLTLTIKWPGYSITPPL